MSSLRSSSSTFLRTERDGKREGGMEREKEREKQRGEGGRLKHLALWIKEGSCLLCLHRCRLLQNFMTHLPVQKLQMVVSTPLLISIGSSLIVFVLAYAVSHLHFSRYYWIKSSCLKLEFLVPVAGLPPAVMVEGLLACDTLFPGKQKACYQGRTTLYPNFYLPKSVTL